MLQAKRTSAPAPASAESPQCVLDAPLAVDPVSQAVLDLARRVAGADVTVMITGESGVGKEVYARYIHACSARRGARFVAVNCAAIPEAMLEAVLFGHEKGAFTGATEARPGKFELADGGTLLLDEITEMPLGLQAKLLRALQEREIERLGAAQPRRIDVRVLATSNRVLRDAVRDSVLREDLYYRLNVFPLHIPPLRERPEDILPLARRLLARHAGAEGLRLAPAAARRLLTHDWPGNVRELENVMQRALILQRDGDVDADAIVLEASTMPGGAANETESAAGIGALSRELLDREGELIVAALHAGATRSEAAERLGISPRTLRYKVARLRAAGVELP